MTQLIQKDFPSLSPPAQTKARYVFIGRETERERHRLFPLTPALSRRGQGC